MTDKSKRLCGPALVLTCTLVAACTSYESSTGSRVIQELDVQLREVLLLGADESASAEYLFGRPRYAVTDAQGSIYVADQEFMNIRVYDDSGRYIRTLGKRGQGPMEFQSFDGLAINQEQELIALDRTNRRVTRFSTEGQLLSTHPRQRWASAFIRPFRDGYLSLSHQTSEPGDIDSLFRVYGSGFDKPTVAFGSTDQFADPYNKIETSKLGTGTFIFTEGGLLYAPSLYEGKLYLFSEAGGQWALTSTLDGLVKKRAYTEVDKPAIYQNADFMIFYAGTEKGARVHNSSLGLFRLQDDRIVHFTKVEFGRQRYFGVEVLDGNGQLVGYGVIEKIPLTAQGIANLFLKVVWKDEQDRFYVIDRTYQPVIRVVELEIRPTDKTLG
ncbi:MAG: 6-bladed beta-propeller [Rhodothermaceae bacterium]|nr:6-bladed beta-propeller [Rhodothermaceae bacterium]MXX58102.1 6-bladed beta-propeller [Rhodothermaceae bacterium]MYD18991.1 6-bladed beta-propeller [Rhodothermaceae bacterium]MYD55385.1 6-bladed beta-propeller [Rhodothermaceae bacterium]MYI43113.1 6-bladed beta-propeller [Rhodothermaceae bacterium]